MSSAWKKIDEVPFDFERRRVSVLFDNGTIRLLVVKGAPDDILRFCTLCEIRGADGACTRWTRLRASALNAQYRGA